MVIIKPVSTCTAKDLETSHCMAPYPTIGFWDRRMACTDLAIYRCLLRFNLKSESGSFHLTSCTGLHAHTHSMTFPQTNASQRRHFLCSSRFVHPCCQVDITGRKASLIVPGLKCDDVVTQYSMISSTGAHSCRGPLPCGGIIIRECQLWCLIKSKVSNISVAISKFRFLICECSLQSL